jgi:hydrogenase small subunit
MKYLGFLPKDVPAGNSKLGYYMRAGFEKTMHTLEVAAGISKSHSEGSK